MWGMSAILCNLCTCECECECVCVCEWVCVCECVYVGVGVCVPMHICVHVYGMCCNGAYRYASVCISFLRIIQMNAALWYIELLGNIDRITMWKAMQPFQPNRQARRQMCDRGQNCEKHGKSVSVSSSQKTLHPEKATHLGKRRVSRSRED